MYFKDVDRFKEEFWQIDPRLRQILCDIEVLAYPEVPVLTCLIRTEEENQAVGAKTIIHCLGRAADIRLFEKDDTNQMILSVINQMYIYDPSRPALQTLIKHHVDGGAEHLHCQVRAIEEVHKEYGFKPIP